MSQRKIQNYENSVCKVTVKYDSDSGDYICRLFENGKMNDEATYETNDKEDALYSAQDMLEKATARFYLNNKTPYQIAFDKIKKGPNSHSGVGFAKLMLSLFRNFPFAFSDCVACFDSENKKFTVELISYYMEHGINSELNVIGAELFDMYPELTQSKE